MINPNRKEPPRPTEEFAIRSRRLSILVISLVLAVLAGVVALTTWQLRQRIRDQMAGRDGEVLYAVAMMHYSEDVKDGLAGPITDPGGQLSVVLKTAQLRGVLGVRLFDPAGRFVQSFPFDMTEQDLDAKYLHTMRQFKYAAQFHPRASMDDLFLLPIPSAGGDAPVPILEVMVPLHTDKTPLAGIAQFLVEGRSIATEYARLDRYLARQALTSFAAGGAVLTLALLWAFRRLRRAHGLLRERTENLVKANQELALAAKTSALGAVTAHLLHGLKNPLAGLQNFISSRASAPVSEEEADWREAISSTQRMQTMVNQIVGVLREEQSGSAYEVTLTELEQIVRGRVQPLAREMKVNFTSLVRAEANLPNRAANLVALILVNLIENALQATPQGKTVALNLSRNDGWLLFEIRDEGGGFPADTPLFMPCRSTKEGGSGIGLALCKQLANHLDSELELASSTVRGCLFTLRLPLAVAERKPTATEERK